MDVTTLILEAQDARGRMQDAKKLIKRQIERKYKAQIRREIEDATQDAEVEFARTLARVNAAGVTQEALRREVLRTNVWSVWTYWRDLAGIEPARVSTRAAKEAAEREAAEWFRWDGGTLILFKNLEGEPLESEVRLTGPWSQTDTGLFTPTHVVIGSREMGEALVYMREQYGMAWGDVGRKLTETIEENGEKA